MAKIQIRNIDHLVLRVRDIERMRAFYCDVLGAEHIAYRPDFAMSHLRVGDCMLDLVEADKRGFAAPGAGRLNPDHFCFRGRPWPRPTGAAAPRGRPAASTWIPSAFASSRSTRKRSSRT